MTEETKEENDEVEMDAARLEELTEEDPEAARERKLETRSESIEQMHNSLQSVRFRGERLANELRQMAEEMDDEEDKRQALQLANSAQNASTVVQAGMEELARGGI